MKNLNGKELMRGDVVLHATADGIVAGAIHQFYDRNEAVRIANYPFHVPAKDTVLAQDAFDAFAVPLLKARADVDAKAKADAATAGTAQATPPGAAANASGLTAEAAGTQNVTQDTPPTP